MQGEFLWLGLFQGHLPHSHITPRKGGQAGAPNPACLITFLEQLSGVSGPGGRGVETSRLFLEGVEAIAAAGASGL